MCTDVVLALHIVFYLFSFDYVVIYIVCIGNILFIGNLRTVKSFPSYNVHSYAS